MSSPYSPGILPGLVSASTGHRPRPHFSRRTDVLLDGSGTCARIAENTPYLRGGSARGSFARDWLTRRGLPFQLADGSAHDGRDRSHRRPRDPAPAQNARQHRGSADKVRQQAAQRTTVCWRKYGDCRRACHRFRFAFMLFVRSRFRHHLG